MEKIQAHWNTSRTYTHWELNKCGKKIIWFSAQIHAYAHAHPRNKKKTWCIQTNTHVVMNYNHKFYRLTWCVLRDKNCNHFLLMLLLLLIILFWIWCVCFLARIPLLCQNINVSIFFSALCEILSHDCYQTEYDTATTKKKERNKNKKKHSHAETMEHQLTEKKIIQIFEGIKRKAVCHFLCSRGTNSWAYFCERECVTLWWMDLCVYEWNIYKYESHWTIRRMYDTVLSYIQFFFHSSFISGAFKNCMMLSTI